MAHIHLLEESIAQKIAAGEVVERPSSVIKELVENSIDAGSTFVTVEIREGGIESLRVTDNGSGIAADEVELAFLRHATSKIQKLDDLYNIQQLGFRGEALYSVAAVSQLEITTKPAAQPAGVRMVIHGGQKQSFTEYGCPDGTTILVRNLFYNTPARLKFLAKPSTEAGYVSSTLLRLILANPAVSIKFISNDKVIYHSTGDGNLVNAIYTIFGREIADGLLPVEGRTETMSLQGALFAPANARGNRGHQILMVNGRNITHFGLGAIVERLYGGTLESKRYPGFVLNLNVPVGEVDVNVHPNKLQVRFVNESAVKYLVEAAVSQALERLKAQTIPWSPLQRQLQQEERELIGHPNAQTATTEEAPQVVLPFASFAPPMGEASVREPLPVHRTQSVGETVSRLTESVQAALRSSGWTGRSATPTTLMQRPSIPNTATQQLPEQEPFLPPQEEITLLGQAFGVYAVLQAGDKLFIIDQHAAHERLWYDRYLARLERQETVSQKLLVPQTIQVTFEAKAIIDENLELMAQLGFEVEEYGRLSYQIRAVPVILGQPQVQDLLLNIVDLLADDRSVRTVELKREKIMSMACKRAVKAGDKLTNDELKTLLGLIRAEGTPLTCPHGRPFALAMEKTALDRHFKRT